MLGLPSLDDYGSPRMVGELTKAGISSSVNTVAKLMRLAGIPARLPIPIALKHFTFTYSYLYRTSMAALAVADAVVVPIHHIRRCRTAGRLSRACFHRSDSGTGGSDFAPWVN